MDTFQPERHEHDLQEDLNVQEQLDREDYSQWEFESIEEEVLPDPETR